MRKQDIKVGEEYAVARGNDLENYPFLVKRVRITGPAEESGRYWGEFINKDGDGTGHTSVTSREVRQPWAEYVVAQAARDEAKARQNDAAHRAAVEAWKQFKRVDDLLGLVGVERQRVFLPRGDVRAAAEVGFDVNIYTVLTALDVVHGRVVVTPAKVLLLAREAGL